MPRLPRPTGKSLVAFLEARDFIVIRIQGSHHVMTKGSCRTVVSIHSNESLKIGTLRGILRDIRMSAQEFVNEWKA